MISSVSSLFHTVEHKHYSGIVYTICRQIAQGFKDCATLSLSYFISPMVHFHYTVFTLLASTQSYSPQSWPLFIRIEYDLNVGRVIIGKRSETHVFTCNKTMEDIKELSHDVVGLFVTISNW